LKKALLILTLLLGFTVVAQQTHGNDPVVKVANLPFDNTLDIIFETNSVTPVEITVYNLIGEQVYKELYDVANKLSLNIPTDRYTKGVYLLAVKQGDYSQTIKITKK
jgi:hypothetical protein